MKFLQMRLTELDLSLKTVRAVQLELYGLVLTNYGETLGFFTSVRIAEAAPCETNLTLSISEFKKAIKNGVTEDVIYLTHSTRKVIAFVSPKFATHLPLPIIGKIGKI